MDPEVAFFLTKTGNDFIKLENRIQKTAEHAEMCFSTEGFRI